MERWAKTLNQKKEVARQSQVAVQQAHNIARAASTADIAFSVLERQESSPLELPLVLPPPSEVMTNDCRLVNCESWVL